MPDRRVDRLPLLPAQPHAEDGRVQRVVPLREGRIVRYRDYWNPLVALHALGGAEPAANAYAGEATHG